MFILGRVAKLVLTTFHKKLTNHVTTSRIYRYKKPEELLKEYEEFDRRMEKETPEIRKVIGSSEFDGMKVVQLGELCWLHYHHRSILLAGAQLQNGRFTVLNYEDGTVSVLSIDTHPGQLILSNLSCFPHLELDDGDIHVGFAANRTLILKYDYEDGWKQAGLGWTGPRALEKFAEHGVTFSCEK